MQDYISPDAFRNKISAEKLKFIEAMQHAAVGTTGKQVLVITTDGEGYGPDPAQPEIGFEVDNHDLKHPGDQVSEKKKKQTYLKFRKSRW